MMNKIKCALRKLYYTKLYRYNPFAWVAYSTADLYEIALFRSLGNKRFKTCKYTGATGPYPKANVNLRVRRWCLWYRKIGIVRYTTFRDNRSQLKELLRKHKIREGDTPFKKFLEGYYDY